MYSRILIQERGKMEEEYIDIGNVDITILKQLYDVNTERLIITKERIQHINMRHNNDYDLYGKYMVDIIKEPDYILKDLENEDTVLYLKVIKELNLQIVIKLQTEANPEKCNTVITFWHMRKRSYEQIVKKNKIIYKKLDRNE